MIGLRNLFCFRAQIYLLCYAGDNQYCILSWRNQTDPIFSINLKKKKHTQKKHHLRAHCSTEIWISPRHSTASTIHLWLFLEKQLQCWEFPCLPGCVLISPVAWAGRYSEDGCTFTDVGEPPAPPPHPTPPQTSEHIPPGYETVSLLEALNGPLNPSRSPAPQQGTTAGHVSGALPSFGSESRRAPSPLISPSERPKLGPPRPSSLPLLPPTPLYSSLYDLRGSITPPSPANPLGDPYFSPSPPLFAPSGAPPAANAALVVSRSLSPTHFLSGVSSPPLHSIAPPTCLSYPHLPPPSPSKPFASKPLPYWTKYDVADWLGYLNLAEHRERFLDNEIDGTHLPSLTKEDYLDLGVTRVGHRMNIERALRRVMDRWERWEINW